MIKIINYGLGNLKALQNVYNKLNIDCCIASKSEDLINASKLILPGVGSFDYAMKNLNNSSYLSMVLTVKSSQFDSIAKLTNSIKDDFEGCTLSIIDAEKI